MLLEAIISLEEEITRDTKEVEEAIMETGI